MFIMSGVPFDMIAPESYYTTYGQFTAENFVAEHLITNMGWVVGGKIQKNCSQACAFPISMSNPGFGIKGMTIPPTITTYDAQNMSPTCSCPLLTISVDYGYLTVELWLNGEKMDQSGYHIILTPSYLNNPIFQIVKTCEAEFIYGQPYDVWLLSNLILLSLTLEQPYFCEPKITWEFTFPAKKVDSAKEIEERPVDGETGIEFEAEASVSFTRGGEVTGEVRTPLFVIYVLISQF